MHTYILPLRTSWAVYISKKNRDKLSIEQRYIERGDKIRQTENKKITFNIGKHHNTLKNQNRKIKAKHKKLHDEAKMSRTILYYIEFPVRVFSFDQ